MTSYNNLSEQEKKEHISKLIVVMSRDEVSFYDTCKIIKYGESRGMFTTTKIGHSAVYENNDLVTSN